MSLLYRPSQYPFKNFFNYLRKCTVEHDANNLPETFINREVNDIISNTPEVSVEINSSEMGDNVFKTNFLIGVKLKLKCINKQTQEEIEYKIYDLFMEFEAFTHIEDSANVSDDERKKILMVDVAYLIFPFIRHQILITTEAMRSTPVQLNNINFEKLLQDQMNISNNDLESSAENLEKN
jgi:preprotein translocase subunit SecB